MQEDRNLYDVPSTVSGWGHISRGLLSRVLRSTTLKILSPYACNYFTRGQGVIMDHSIQICAHQPYELTGPCHGDSGVLVAICHVLLLCHCSNYLLVKLKDEEHPYQSKHVFRQAEPLKEKVCKCGKPTFTGRIILGEEVIPHSIPFQVLIQFYENNQLNSSCGGALISPNFVVTAGHCGENVEPNDAVVVVGEHNLQVRGDGEQFYNVKKIIMYPGFRWSPANSTLNDMALFQLTNPVTLSDTVSLVCLPDMHEIDDIAGTPITASGWGATENKYFSPVLKATRLLQTPPRICEEDYGMIDAPIDQIGHICAYQQNCTTSVCFGDSGGPMTVLSKERVVLIGVNSLSLCGISYFTNLRIISVGARVTTFTPWILQNSDAGEWQCD